MKKAVIVGGSNGIGLALVNNLTALGYSISILDRTEPDVNLVCEESRIEYFYCDLLDFNEDLMQHFSCDPDVEILMITAGFGRIADFEHFHPAEIRNMLEVNTVAAIRTIRYFYDRIKSDAPFYCGMMGSIAGLMTSPMFSVYAASKAAVCRFTESVNIELEAGGYENRILNVAPGSVKGTRFNGGENDLLALESLAESIVKKLFSRETLYIPDYESVYQSVLERYHQDPHEYGLYSYQYKKDSGRANNGKRVCIGYLSGTFDLFHIGHLNLIRRAKQQCDYLIVGVHPVVRHKKKETFIPYEERMAIVGACRYVDRVVAACSEDSDAWDRHHFDKLFVGSDYKGTERFQRYEEYFADKGVEIVYFGYTQNTSSTQIRAKIVAENNKK